MENWTVRERAGLAALVFALVVGAAGVWTYRQQSGLEPVPSLMRITPPQMSTEVLARGRGESGGVAVTEQPDRMAVPGAPIAVYVSGAVRRPGVYTLKSGDRIYKAIRAAGGPKRNALLESLNLVDPLRDGDQVHVASRDTRGGASAPPPLRHATSSERTSASEGTGEEAPRGRVLGDPPTPAAPARSRAIARKETARSVQSEGAEKLKNPGDGTVNINTAGAEELQRLPGVGPAMAERILTYRAEVGSFNAPEQLLDVRGVGEKKFAAMQPFVRVK